MTPTFLPPQNWTDFEKFLKGLVDVIWKQEGWQLYGRSGQKQNGIDLIGYDDSRRYTAIQAKKISNVNPHGQMMKHSTLTEAIITKEIENAEKIDNPKLERLIFATTAFRDVHIQKSILKINDERIKNNKFRVDIWFWEDLHVHIEQHKDLMYFYYADVLDNIYQYDKDEHILLTFRRAFTRPAFDRPMKVEESGADFIEAIKDTMETITTGKLYNRRNELLASTYEYQKLTDISWKKELRIILQQLNKIRTIYAQGVQNNQIRQHPSCLEIMDNRLRKEFDEIRRDCLMRMNTILKDKNLQIIDSDLLH